MSDWDEAIRIHEEALAEQPEHPALLYNLACMEARGGRHLDALAASAAARSSSSRSGRRARARDTGLRLDPPRAGLPRLRTPVPAVARQACPRGKLAERRHRIGLRPRDEQHGAELVVGSRALDEQVQADRERERLVRLLAAERHELLRPRQPGEHGAVA